MRSEGTLSQWHDDRGFGFITPAEGGPKVFVHISAFPKDGRRPTVGERLSFEIVVAPNGKRQAAHVFCPDRPAIYSARPTAVPAKPRPHHPHKNRLGFLLPVIAIVLAIQAYNQYSTSRIQPPMTPASTAHTVAPSFQCDGRTRCSQMTSCAEATYFLSHCPSTEMDGDHDGIPCEDQWCGH